MAIFHDNFRFIRDSLSELRGVSYSLQNLADIFGVKKLTVYGWLTQGKNPLHVSLQSVARNTKEVLGWDVTPEELTTVNIRYKYSIDSKKDEQIDIVAQSYSTNIIDFVEIAQRLKNLREQRGWSLKFTSKKTTDLFPNQQEYHVSHTHIADIEKQNVVNYHINKIKALATVYGTTIDYILFGRNLPKQVTVDRDNDLLIIPMKGRFKDATDRDISEVAEKVVDMLSSFLGKKSEEIGSGGGMY